MQVTELQYPNQSIRDASNTISNCKMPAQLSAQKPVFERSCCPITNGLDIFGDKWTLLIVRDLMLGKRRYQDLISSPENIASNILADRLKRLETAGLVDRRAYQQSPARYEYILTEKGRDLKPVLEAIVAWGTTHCPDTMVFAPFSPVNPR